MRSRWLDRSLIQGVFLTLCTTEKQYAAAVRHLKVSAPEPWIERHWDACVHTFETDGKFTCVVCIPAYLDKSGIEIASLLVHEATHVWQRTKERIGETSPSKEFEAYAMQNITFQLLTEYHRQTTKA